MQFNTIIFHFYKMNIQQYGRVPTSPETFEVNVTCSGRKTGSVNIETNISLHITYQQNSEKITITIKRLKKCKKSRKSKITFFFCMLVLKFVTLQF